MQGNVASRLGTLFFWPLALAALGGPAVAAAGDSALERGLLELTLDKTEYSVGEDAGILQVEVKLTGIPSDFVNVTFQTIANSTAQPGVHFQPVDVMLEFPPSSQNFQTQIVQIPILDNSVWQPDRFFQVWLLSPTGGASLGMPRQAVVTIEEDDPPPAILSLELSRIFINEDDDNLEVAIFRNGNFEIDTEVTLTTIQLPGGAVAGQDYVEVHETVFFKAGDQGKIVLIPLIDDNTPEDDEDFRIGLVNPGPGAALDTPIQALVTIIDDDMQPSVVALGAPQFIADEGQEEAAIPVVRQGDASGPAEVTLATVAIAGGAEPNVDFLTVNERVYFEPGDDQPRIVAIPIVDDSLSEGPESFGVRLTAQAGTILGAPGQAVVFIEDDDAPAGAFRFAQAAYETPEDIGQAFVEVVRVDGANGPASVLVSTRPRLGDASAGADFVAFQETLFFADGETGPVPVGVTIVDDSQTEDREAFEITLSNPDGAGLTQPSVAEVAIIDNDGDTGSFRFESDRYAVAENAGALTVAVGRVGGTDGEASVTLATAAADGAVAGEDYAPVQTVLHFAAGEAGPQTVDIPILDDNAFEGPEAFGLTLSQPVGAALGEPNAALAIIEDDETLSDQLAISWESPGQRVAEDDEGAKRAVAVTVAARLSAPAPQTVRAAYRIDGSAELGMDHDLEPGFVTFAQGATEAFVNFNVLGDTRAEPDELLVLTLEDTAGLRRAQPFVHAVVIEDNDASSQPDTRILSPGGSAAFAVGETVQFQAEVANAQANRQYQFRWEICGSTGDCGEQTGAQFSFAFQTPGLYVASCAAFDDAGNFDATPDQVFFRVEQNICPEAVIVSPAQDHIRVEVGETVRLVGEIRGSDQYPPIWSFAGDLDRVIHRGATFDFRPDRPGLYALAFRAEGAPKGKAFDTIQIQASRPGDMPSSVAIEQPADGARVNVGEPVQFIGAATQPAAKNDLQYAWFTGDGGRLEGLEPEPYTYQRPGRYRVTLAGFGPGGQRFLDAITLRVVDPDRAPAVNVNFPTNLQIQPGESIFFKSVVVDNRGRDNRDLRFQWRFSDGREFRSRTPGLVSFPDAGEVTVTLTATNVATGKTSDPITRIIAVRETADGDFEPNDTFGQAPDIGAGSYGNLILDDDSGTDVYKLTVDETGQRLVVEANADGPALVELFNAEQQKLGEGEFEGEFEAQLQNLPAGDYFLRFTQAPTSGKRRATLGYSFGLSVLNPALFLPEIQQNAQYATEVGLVNTVNDYAFVDAIAFDDDGNLLDSVQFELPPLGRSHQGVDALFADYANEIAWLQIDSDQNLIGYTRVESRDAKEVYGVSASFKLSSELFVPHIADQFEQWFTRASVINGIDSSSVSKIVTPTQEYNLQLGKAFLRDNFDFLERFGGSHPSGKLWAKLTESNAQPALAGAEVFGTTSEASRMTAGLSLEDIRRDNPNFTYVGKNLYFTHVARNTDLFWTGLALVNPNAVPVDVRIYGYGSDGQATSLVRTLEPNEKAVELAELFLDGIGSPADIDWIMVESDADVVGFELFGTHDQQRIAGLEAATALRTELCYPFLDVSADVAHGIAVVNVNDLEAELTFTLYDNDGSPLASVPRTLGARQKLSITVEDLFADADLPADRIPGWLACSSTRPIAGFELFLDLANNEQLGALVAQ